MTTQLWTLWGVVHNITPVGQTSETNIPSNLEQMILGGGGAIDPTFVAVKEQRPSFEFTTNAIAVALGLAGIDGIAIAPAALFKGFLQATTEGGGRPGGSAHQLVTITKGILVPRQLSAQGTDDAKLTMEAVAAWDGTNDPIKFTASSALVGDATATEAFVCGPVVLNGVTIEGILSITIDFGLTFLAPISSGEIYPRFITINQRRPVITIETSNASLGATYGLSGVPQDATDSLVYFRKVLEGGGRVPIATTQHISFGVDEGIFFIESIPASDGDFARTRITFTPSFDGTAPILAISTAVAIVLP